MRTKRYDLILIVDDKKAVKHQFYGFFVEILCFIF